MSGSEYGQKQKQQTNKQNPTNNQTNIFKSQNHDRKTILQKRDLSCMGKST
jgi:hypothetical protein